MREREREEQVRVKKGQKAEAKSDCYPEHTLTHTTVVEVVIFLFFSTLRSNYDSYFTHWLMVPMLWWSSTILALLSLFHIHFLPLPLAQCGAPEIRIEIELKLKLN